jgi:hypothetical protein
MTDAPTAPELARVQRWLQTAITHPGSAEEGVRAAGEPAHRLVQPSSRMQPLARVAVYQHAYFARLIDCLAQDYPALHALLGPERFAELGRRYVASRPPRAPSLNAYGRELPDFLAHERNDAALADLARIEWAYAELIHAPQVAAVSAADLLARSASFSDARLLPVPALRLLRLEYPLHPAYLALRAGRPVQLPAAEPAFVLVHRPQWIVTSSELSAAEGELLASLLAGTAVGPALATAAEHGTREEDVGAWFQRWLAAGMFAALA